MKDIEITFYDDGNMSIPIGAELSDIVDDSTTEITIETPEGWKCERDTCKVDYLHKHSTYSALATDPNAIAGTPAQ